MRFYFDWIVDHRLTDFLAAKRDLFMYPPDESSVEQFRAAIRALVSRIESERPIFASDAQRQFLMRRLAQELEPLLDVSLAADLGARIAEAEAHLVEVQDLARAHSAT